MHGRKPGVFDHGRSLSQSADPAEGSKTKGKPKAQRKGTDGGSLMDPGRYFKDARAECLGQFTAEREHTDEGGQNGKKHDIATEFGQGFKPI